MSAATLLAQVRALGVAVRASGDNVALRPIAAVPDELKAALKAAKPEILALLQAEAVAAAPLSQDAPGAAPAVQPTRPIRPGALPGEPPDMPDPPPFPFEAPQPDIPMRRCVVPGCAGHAHFGFGPPLRRDTVWTCRQHRAYGEPLSPTTTNRKEKQP